MYHKKECVAMLLAGGQGSRLYTLTEKTAKPAVPFGGKYRIIDFPLSNCVNSGIDTAEINRLLFDSKSMEVLAVEKAGLDTLKMFHNGKIAVVFFTYQMKQKLGVLDEHLETLIDVARSVEGVDVAVAIRQPGPEKTFRVSTRSSNAVDVSMVCAFFGGGGHIRAAGCTIVADCIEHVADLVVTEIEKQLF